MADSISNILEACIRDAATASGEMRRKHTTSHAYYEKLRSMVWRVLRRLIPSAMVLSHASVIPLQLIEK